MTPPVDDLKIEIKQAIVRSLRLPMAPEEIDDATPLFGESLFSLDGPVMNDDVAAKAKLQDTWENVFLPQLPEVA